MAEFIMKDLVKRANIENIYVESAATSNEEIGNGVYPPARYELARHGIECRGKVARRINKSDCENFDFLIGMDDANIRNMKRMFGADGENKIFKLLQFSGLDKSVDDPWYSGDFTTAYNDIFRGCSDLLAYIREKY